MGKDTYIVAYRQAADRLRLLDPGAVCQRSGARLAGDDLVLAYFDRELEIALPSMAMSAPEPHQEEQILILHYLVCYRLLFTHRLRSFTVLTYTYMFPNNRSIASNSANVQGTPA